MVASLNIPANDLQFLHGSGDQNAAVGFGLNDSFDSVTFLFEITAWHANNQLWWYDLNDTNTKGLLIGGAQFPLVTNAVSVPVSQWGLLYFTQEADGGGATHTYYSGTGPGQTGSEQFALFQQNSTGSYYVGIEDIPSFAPRNDFDYNDGMVKIIPSAKVPVPSTLLLVGGGLVGLAALRLRRR